jgi:hypothetical protein
MASRTVEVTTVTGVIVVGGMAGHVLTIATYFPVIKEVVVTAKGNTGLQRLTKRT